MNKEIGEEIVFFHAGTFVVATIFELNPTGYSTKYLYKAKGKDGTNYLIKKEDLMK